MVGDVFFESLLKKLKEASKSDYQSICDSFLDSQVDSVMQTRISCIDTVEKNFRDGLQKFLAHQDSIWYDVFSLSQSMYQIAVDSSKAFSDYYRTSLEPSKRASLQYTFIALEQIHGRACQEFLEILYLMRLGFADGAFARWRSLFELQCTALFISQQGETIAKQFIDASFGGLTVRSIKTVLSLNLARSKSYLMDVTFQMKAEILGIGNINTPA